MIRLFDITLSLLGLVISFPVLVVIFILGIFDTGSPIFIQQRVGRYKKPFMLVKFRTMNLDTADVASHLASRSSVTALGDFLRRTKLDEIPQLWNVLWGDMSLVGPRPCLYSQHELIEERELRGVFSVRPGITGLSQVSDIDMSTPSLLAETDAKMMNNLSTTAYYKYLLMTVVGRGRGDRVR